MTGMVMIVTGASSGIGFEVAKYLAEGGNDVVMACRDPEKGQDAVRCIKSILPNSLVTFMQLDLASTTSIREFVRDFLRKKKKLSVLVNNAAVALNFSDLTRKTTSEGFELTMVTNYLGPFLLTNLLLDCMIQTSNVLGEGRIINVTCAAHNQEGGWGRGRVDFLHTKNFQLQDEGTYNGLQAYKNSKVCGLLFTYYLGELLQGTRVKINAIDPGTVPTTELLRHAGKLQQVYSLFCVDRVLRPCLSSSKKVHEAAMQIAELATSDKFEGRSGKFFRDGLAERSSIESYDSDLQKAVWRISCQLVNYRSNLVNDTLDDISLSSLK
ncbi:hypothetical protein NP493_295g05017 [Ridgeia piscesae]|uniref:Uncharacterized protein n=1 Tax=Ridgeia piscesae TaxID=27915 RepID=A0AAD9NWM4_RIDPI|nr:hypothetical protein NP493_295g05017 [Ridgeia piscesae]